MFPTHIIDDAILSIDQLIELERQLDIENKTYKTSHIFDTKKKENIINKHLRSSEKIEYVNENLFNFVDLHVIAKLNQNNKTHEFYLVRNDLEVIKYKEGDYFKKHQDYINFNSNEFRNYTFLICLKACQEGGETVLYLDANDINVQTEIKSTAKKEGSILLFQKDVIHEGKEILKGEKYILKGNLLCFEKSHKKELLIITFPNTDKYYILPVETLKKNTIYSAFCNFDRMNNKQLYIHYYKEEFVPLEYFIKYYWDNYASECSSYEKMCDYIGDEYHKFNKFINNYDDKKITICSMNEYYNLLDVKIPDDVLPFQYISLAADNDEVIIWFGVYDNRFVTFDHYISLDESENNDVDLIKKYLDAYTKNGKEIRLTIKEIMGGYYKSDRFREGRYWTEDEMVRQYIWEKFGLKKMEEIMKQDPKLSKYDQMNRYIADIISGMTKDQVKRDEAVFLIDTHNDRYEYREEKTIESNESTEESESNESTEDSEANESKKENEANEGTGGSEVNESKKENEANESTEESEVNESIELSDDKIANIRKLDIKKLIEEIRNQDALSTVKSANFSEYHCNETYYVTVDVIHKFGFIKYKEFLFKM